MVTTRRNSDIAGLWIAPPRPQGGGDSADLSNVIPFGRHQQPVVERSVARVTITAEDRPAVAPARSDWRWQLAVIAGSLLIHSSVFL